MTVKTPRVWTDADDALLRELIGAGSPAKLIAFKLKGTEPAVIARAKTLGLTLAPTGPVRRRRITHGTDRRERCSARNVVGCATHWLNQFTARARAVAVLANFALRFVRESEAKDGHVLEEWI